MFKKISFRRIKKTGIRFMYHFSLQNRPFSLKIIGYEIFNHRHYALKIRYWQEGIKKFIMAITK